VALENGCRNYAVLPTMIVCPQIASVVTILLPKITHSSQISASDLKIKLGNTVVISLENVKVTQSTIII
jgi:hypothetical protein